MDIDRLSPRLQRVFAWIGPLFVVLFMIGFLLSGLFPPMSPGDSAEEIARFYADDTTAIRIGCVFMIVALSLFAPWGAAVAMWTKRTERGFPLLTYTQLISLGACTCVVVLIPLVWATAAFRPEDTSPDVTRMLNDVAWFLFLFSWPPFSVWTGSVGLAIIRDRSPEPTFPRWTAYLSFWTAFLFVPAGLMAFFKSGPMAFDGVIAFYIPLFIFLIWVVGVTRVMLQHIARSEREVADLERVLATS